VDGVGLAAAPLEVDCVGWPLAAAAVFFFGGLSVASFGADLFTGCRE
jgi:hypothetical protein